MKKLILSAALSICLPATAQEEQHDPLTREKHSFLQKAHDEYKDKPTNDDMVIKVPDNHWPGDRTLYCTESTNIAELERDADGEIIAEKLPDNCAFSYKLVHRQGAPLEGSPVSIENLGGVGKLDEPSSEE